MKWNSFNIFLAILLLFSTKSSVDACGNEYGYNKDGEMKYTRYLYFSPQYRGFDDATLRHNLEDVNKKISLGSADFRDSSNLALYKMKLGEVESSLLILNDLMKSHPDEYTIVANLGTAYELASELDSALKYIQIGLDLNPHSHDGSEWVHVKILKAKLQEKRTPGWLDANPIITNEDLVARGGNNSRLVINNLTYQLRTRAPFTPAPNKVMANLLMSLGDYALEYDVLENALLAYLYALEFESNSSLERKIKTKVQKVAKVLDLQINENLRKDLPSEFVRIIRLNKLNPDLLVHGMDSLELFLDSLDMVRFEKEDSLLLLKKQIDSLKPLIPVLETVQSEGEEEIDILSSRWLVLIMALMIGLGLGIVLMKYRNKS